jgi:LPXTG-site transpeptidase (sortase) family protein
MSHSGIEKKETPPFAVFIAAAIVIFFLSLSAADSIGFVPDYIDGTAPAQTVADTIDISSASQIGAIATSSATVLPTRISVPAVGIDLEIQNPTTKNLDALDALLVNGPARYVDSAKLGEVGTMIVFAHSSHLPIVHNKMYQAFNQIPNLKAGDSITLTGTDGTQYLYSVTKVYKADATNTSIDMSPTLGTRLVLVTCDTLTGKSARFVLEAQLVGTI